MYIIELAKQIDSTHPGLGRYFALCYLIIRAGFSVVLVGEPGLGKGTIANLFGRLQDTDRRIVISLTNGNLSELVAKIGTRREKQIVISIPESQTMMAYARDVFLPIWGQVASDYHIDRLVGPGGALGAIRLENCFFSVIMASTVDDFKTISRNPAFKNLVKDRSFIIPVVNPLRPSGYASNTKPNFIEPPVYHHVDKEQKIHPRMLELISEQSSSTRAVLKAQMLQIVWCQIEQKRTFEDTDMIVFETLFGVYLKLLKKLMIRWNLEDEPVFQAAFLRILDVACRNGMITTRMLLQEYNMKEDEEVSLSTTSRHLQLANHSGIIQKSSRSEQSQQIYSVVDEIKRYFDNYRGLLQ